jgi:hypothetical protein
VTSNINYASINENFPVAGEDNDTQTFRDNFDTIKTSLLTAKNEVEDLQDNVARTDLDNDFNWKVISRAVMKNNYDAKWDGGTVGAATTIDFENGPYQIYRFTADATIDFLNFPDDNTLPASTGKVTLEIYSSGVGTKTLSFSTSGGTVIKKNSSFPTSLTVSSAETSAGGGNPIIVEVWRHKSDRIFLNYLGQFSS